MPGDRKCLPKCLLPGREACSTGDVVSKCHYRSQPRILSHRLQQVGDQPGIFSGTGVYGHRVTGQASTSFPQSKRDGQTVYEMGQCGTCRTYVGQAPAESQHVPMCTQVSSCPFFFCRCRARLKLRRSSILLFRLAIPTYESISETDT